MAGAARLYAAATILFLTVAPLPAAELSAPAEPLPPAPIFYLHAGALGAFFETNAQPTGGGLFTTENIAIRPVYTVALEAGYYITPNLAIAISTAVPPLVRLKATGFPGEALFGTNLLGSVRGGPLIVFLRYQFNQFGPIQPYVGVGTGYVLNFGNISDGILAHFSVDSAFVFHVRAGAEWMLTPNWGLYIEGRKTFLSTDAQGFAFPGPVPMRSHVTLDPWLASTGITFKY